MPRPRLRPALAASAVLLLSSLAALVATAAEPDSPDRRGAEAVEAMLADPKVQADLRRQERELEQRRQERATPEARARRAESRRAHRGLAAAEARQLARSTFPEVIDKPRWRRPDLPEGERLGEFRGSSAALIERDEGGKSLLSSSQPMLGSTRTGKQEPIDLDLVERDGELQPRNSAVDVGLPKRLGHRVRVGESIRFAPPGGGEATAEQVAGKAFYANVDTDTDFVVTPMPTGVESFHVLRSEASPEAHPLVFVLPQGASIQADDGEHGGGAAVVAGDRVLMTISPPAAVDAEGEPVPVSLEAQGDQVTLRVPHRAGDFAYPILVDPVYEDQLYWDQGDDMVGWHPYASSPRMHATQSYPGGLRGLYAYGETNFSYNGTEWATWWFPSYRSSFIFRAEFANSWHFAASTYLFRGIYSSALGQWQALRTDLAPLSNNWHVACVNSSCSPQGPDGNQAQFGLSMYGAGVRTAVPIGYVGGTWLVEHDFNAPWVAGVNDPFASGWHAEGEVSTAAVEIADAGLGASEIELQTPGFGDGMIHPCWGDRLDRCPGTFAWNFPYTTDELPEGVNTFTVYAWDVTDNRSAPTQYQVRVDRSNPVVSTSGTATTIGGKRITDGRYGLRVDATDGSSSAPRSGVKSIEITLDGRRVDFATQSCAQGSCGMSREWTLQTERYAEGKHTLAVRVTDQVGHVETTSWEFTLARAAIADVGAGAVDLLTGNLRIGRDDVSIPAWGSALTLSRTFNSRDADGEPNSLFGPGWVASLPVDAAGTDFAELLDTADNGGDGTVELTDSEGYEYAFARASGAGYTSPPGLEELKLTKPSTTTFELKDLNGNVTVFTKPVGSTVYKPTAIRQPGTGDNTTSISYEVVGTVTRPVEILAPAPPGVTAQVRTRSALGDEPSPGARSLTFHYASTTTASGKEPAQWGDFEGRLQRVEFVAYDTNTAQVTETPVAQYSYDDDGRLRAAWDPRISPPLKETYDYDAAGHVTKVTPAGQEPWTISYSAIPGDPETGRLRSVSRPALPGTATTTVVYDVPRTGSSAPYQMASSDVAAWGQTDVPTTATAIFPPDQVPADPPASYSRATIHYLDAHGREVNVATPRGAISTTEYTEHDDVRRELSAANRERALAPGGDTAARSRQLDTQRTYNADGTELREELGPLHRVKLSSGEVVDARRHTMTTYDEGAPSTGGPYHLPTTTTVGAQVPGRSGDADVRTTRMSYDGQSGLGWKLRKPTTVVVDPGVGRLNLTTTTVYDDKSGLPVEERTPGNPGGGDANTTRTIYYTAAGNAEAPECGDKPWWANLPCRVMPGGQPNTAGLPQLLSTTFAYNQLNQVTTETESNGTATRTTTTTYDVAGRPVSQAVSASEGHAVPTTTTTYNPDNGLVATESTTDGEISRTYDTLGRMTTYTDADGNTSTMTYDLLGRLVTTNDGKGTQTRGYDPVTGDLTSLDDSAAGTFTATYDADGRPTSETLPNGVTAETTYDETGEPTRIRYLRGDGCSSNCTIYDDQVTSSIHGQWLTETTTASERSYQYDAAGRLTRASSPVASGGCTIRQYSYDADSNRTALSTGNGDCAGGAWVPSGTSNHAYDAADRIADAGYLYDEFGNIESVPAADAGGHTLTSTYYADNRIRSVTQNGQTHAYERDPAGRVGQTISSAGASATATYHYSDESDSPSWIDGGLAGPQSLANAPATAITDHSGNTNNDRWANAGNARQADGQKTSVTVGGLSSPSDNLIASGFHLLEEESGSTESGLKVPAGAHIRGVRFTYGGVSISGGNPTLTLANSDAGGGGADGVGITSAGNATITVGYGTLSEGATRPRGNMWRGLDLGSAAGQTAAREHLADATLRVTARAANTNLLINSTFSIDYVKVDVDWIVPNLARWTRNIPDITGDLAAIQDSLTGVSYQVSNLHGDIVATIDAGGDASSISEPDEFGVPATSVSGRYAYLGAKRRETALPTGVVAMGERVYNPHLGRFLQVDPVRGGSANAYDYANADPVNQFDLDGRQAGCKLYVDAHIIRRRGRRYVEGEFYAVCFGHVGAKITASIRRHRSWRPDKTVASRQRTFRRRMKFSLLANCKRGQIFNVQATLNYHSSGEIRDTLSRRRRIRC